MGSSSNRMSINFDAALPRNVYDEETWLVEPPGEPNSSNSPGHVVQWLQEATLNVDYETRSALARKLAKQAAKKKKKAEKLSEELFESDAKKSLCLSNVKEDAYEKVEEAEEDLPNENCPVEVARSISLNNNLKTAVDSLPVKDVESLLMVCGIASETSSDEEFYDVPEYPSFQSPTLTEQKAVEKVRPLSHDLTSVKECSEDGRYSVKQDMNDRVDTPQPTSRFSDRSDVIEGTPVKQMNTARVPPTVVLDKEGRRFSGISSIVKGGSPPVIKSHSVAGADLVDIQRKAIQQELALREECNLWKPSSQTDCSSSAVRLRAASSAHPDIMKGSLSMSSSRSADFLDTPHPNTVSSVSSSRISRLPTLVRRPGLTVFSGGTSRFSNSSAMRPYCGDAAGTLSGRRPTDAQSECGRVNFQRKPWTDSYL